MRLARPAAAAALLSAGLLITAPAAVAQAPVDPYSEVGVEAEILTRSPSSGGQLDASAPSGTTRGAVARVPSTPTTLPFTGGELVGISAAGAALTAAGVGLVLAARRRTA